MNDTEVGAVDPKFFGDAPPLSANAQALRAFIYDFWPTHRRGPSFRDIHEALGMSRRQLLLTYRELHAGWMVVVEDTFLTVPLLKAMPFCSYPTDYRLIIDGDFIAFLGCASEALSVSNFPAFSGRELLVEACCECCATPITIRTKGMELLDVQPDTAVIHVVGTPWDWAGAASHLHGCDAHGLALDRTHADRFEQQVGRKGVVATPEQFFEFVGPLNRARGWMYEMPALTAEDPAAYLDTLRRIGIETSAWEDNGDPPS